MEIESEDYEDDLNLDEEGTSIWRILMIALPLLFALITLILFSIIISYEDDLDSRKKRDNLDALRNLDYLSSQPLLKSLQLSSSKTPCPTGLQKQKLGDYGGAVSNCVCKDGSLHSYGYCAFTSDCEY